MCRVQPSAVLRGSRASDRLASVCQITTAQRVALFRLSEPMHLSFCAAGLLSSGVAVIVSPSGWFLALLLAVYFGILLYARRRVRAFDDEERACDEFSSWWVMLSWAVSIGFIVGNHFFQICIDVPDHAVLSIALQGVGAAIYMNLNGMSLSYRIASYTSLLLFLVAPKYSVMPDDQCTVVHWGCMFIGEVMGVQLARVIAHWASVRLTAACSVPEQLTAKLGAELHAEEDVPSIDELLRRLASRLRSVEAVCELTGLDRYRMCFEDQETEMTYLAHTLARSPELYFMTAVMALAVCATGIYFSPTFRLLGVPATVFTLGMLLSWYRVRAWSDAAYAYVVLCEAWKWAGGLTVLACVLVRLAVAHAVPFCDKMHIEWPLAAECTGRAPCAPLMPWGVEFQNESSSDGWVGEACALVLTVTLGMHHRLVPLPFHVCRANHVILMTAVLYTSLNAQDDPSGRVLSASVLPRIGIYSCVLILGELLGYTMDHVRRRLFHDELMQARVVAFAAQANAKLAEVEANAQELERANATNRAEMAADKRLNHVIKGRCGSAISSIDLYTSLITPHLKHELPSELKELLVNSVAHLREAIEWCHRRQVFVQLEKRTYLSRPTHVDYRAMLGSFLSHSDTLVCPDESHVLVDETVLKISVDEIVSNALKYRRKRSHLRVSARLSDGMLRVDIVNTNPRNCIPLTPEECKRVMLPGFKSRTCSAMSDGVGLDSVNMAVAAASGSVTFAQDAENTTVCLELPASPCLCARADSDMLDGLSPEASVKGELLETKMPSQTRSPASAAMGVLRRKTAALSPLLPRSGSDSTLDGLIIREMARLQLSQAVRTAVGLCSGGDVEGSFCSRFFSALSAERSVLSPATPSGHQSFLQTVFGHNRSILGASTSNDVVLLSESLSGVRAGLQGVDVAAHLREQGFAGVVCCLAARKDERLLSEAEHIDVIVRGTSDADVQRAVFDVQAAFRLHYRRHLARPLGAILNIGRTCVSERRSSEPSERAPVDEATTPIECGSDSDVKSIAEPPLFSGTSEFSATERDGETALMTDLRPSPPYATFQKSDAAAVIEEDGCLRCLGLDDERIPRHIQRLFMCHHLKADMKISGVLGETQVEMERFVDVALGHLDLKLQSTHGEPRPADVVLLDENIAPPHVLGSQIAAQLREKGFQGVIVLLTGASREQVMQLSELAAVDLAFEKGVPLSDMGHCRCSNP